MISTSSQHLDSNNLFVWFGRCFKRFGDFEGRSRRKEYWSFTLVNLLILLSLTSVTSLVGLGGDAFTVALVLQLLVTGVPGLAVTVRRLHDIGCSGWWVLLQLVPYVGPLVLLMFLVLGGTRGPNRFGPDPKAQAEVDLGKLERVFS